MGILYLALYWALQLFWLLLMATFIIQLLRTVNPTYRPRGVWLFLFETALTVTDVPLRFLRRFIKPLRVGPVAFDVAFTVLVAVVLILQGWLTAQF